MSLETANQTNRQAGPQPPAIPAGEAGWSGGQAFGGLIWSEWYAHGKLLLFLLAVWLAAVWILPLYTNPAWILAFGGLFALIAGPVYGGSDTTEGCEEFSFSLPPTRGERYLARLVMSAGALLVFTAMDLAALGLDLSQILAKLYVDSGLIRPSPVFRSGLLFGLVLALPLTVFSFAFVISAVTRSRGLLLSAPLWSILISLSALRLGFWYEELVWGGLNGRFSCPVLLLLSAAVLGGGYLAYQRKEVGYPAAPLAVPGRWWLWILLIGAAIVLTLTLTISLARHYLPILTGP